MFDKKLIGTIETPDFYFRGFTLGELSELTESFDKGEITLYEIFGCDDAIVIQVMRDLIEKVNAK